MEGQSPRGVLYPAQNAKYATVDTYAPNPLLADYVECYWHVRWEVPEGQTFKTKVLSHPNVHVVFEKPAPLVYGVQRELFTRELHKSGQVLGVKFVPGGFRSISGIATSKVADQRISAAEIFGDEIAQLSSDILAAPDANRMVLLAEEFLCSRLPESVDPLQEEAAAIVTRITTESSMLRVEHIAAEFNISVRTLQRIFAEYVGASPKWVLRRARLHEVAAQASDGSAISWSGLAAGLGYSDQAHLIRDFTAAVGVPPAHYAAAVKPSA